MYKILYKYNDIETATVIPSVKGHGVIGPNTTAPVNTKTSNECEPIEGPFPFNTDWNEIDDKRFHQKNLKDNFNKFIPLTSRFKRAEASDNHCDFESIIAVLDHD